jgi:hypothetical protein
MSDQEKKRAAIKAAVLAAQQRIKTGVRAGVTGTPFVKENGPSFVKHLTF